MIIADYHTHSAFSKDAKNTIEENIQMAIQKGLKQIGVTEHAYTSTNGIKKSDFNEIKKEIERLRKKYPQIKILFGIEANLINQNGDIDVTPEEQELLDFVILGCHKRCKGNFFSHIKMTAFKNKKTKQKNTDAYITAIKNNKINIIAHLHYACAVDVIKIAKVAKEENVFIELNRRKMLFTKKEIEEMIKLGVKFVANSDAHSANSVGVNNTNVNTIKKYNIPYNQVVNWNKVAF